VLNDDALKGDESASAWGLAREALPKYASSRDRNAFTRRMGSYLQRRGYTFDVIRPIVDQLWAEVSQYSEDESKVDSEGK
jgi:regulatory protein